MNKKQKNRKRRKRFLSVVPVTSREQTGTTARQPNVRAIMKQRVAVITRRIERDSEEINRLNAAITALGSKR